MSTKLTGWGKIAIGTRLNDRCDPHFFNCWSHLIAGGLRAGDTVLDAGIELPQHFAATALTTFFLRSDADTILMVDTDMIFKPDTLSRLRDDKTGWQYDILSALSVTRRRPWYPIILKRRKKPKGNEPAYECLRKEVTGGIMDVDAVGTGFTLIRRSVFDQMRKKLRIRKWYFDFGDGGMGEDTRFCQRAKSVKARIGVHTGIGIGHRGPITWVWDHKKKKTMMESHDQIRDVFLT